MLTPSHKAKLLADLATAQRLIRAGTIQPTQHEAYREVSEAIRLYGMQRLPLEHAVSFFLKFWYPQEWKDSH